MQVTNFEPLIKFTWSILDNDGYVYMDTWEIPVSEWEVLTEEEIKTRQDAQYAAWREYMANPGSR